MSLQAALFWLRVTITSLAIFSTTYLYLYPYHLGCAFPSTTGSTRDGFTHTLNKHLGRVTNDTTVAPFRLLVLADPQLEGDSSLPDPEDALLARISAHKTRILHSFWTNVTVSQNVITEDTTDEDVVPTDIQLTSTDGNGTLTNSTESVEPISWDVLNPNDTLHIEQDETIPTTFTPLAPFRTFATCLRELFLEDIPRSLWAVRKTIDLFGNDYYLAHIYRTLHWWSSPTHVTVLGDLIGSQWVSDDEFSWRSYRFWNRVFAGSRAVEDKYMDMHLGFAEDQEELILDDTWQDQIINIAGNHDIGYAGDISRARLERFEREFGKVNWDVKFKLSDEAIPQSWKDEGREVPKIQLIVLNSMLLDTPALDGELQSATYGYINGLIGGRLEPVEKREEVLTLMLTHVPLHKPEGVCVDAPMFEFWDFEDADGAFKDGGLKEQNHLSDHTSHQGILQAIWGMHGDVGAPGGGKGRKGLILNGHDHEGCEAVHYIERTFKYVTLDTGLESEGESNKGQQTSEHDQANDVSQEADQEQKPTASAMEWAWKSVSPNDYAEIEGNQEQGKLEIVTSLREITMRSMMGEFGGNAGLMSAWFDFDQGTWKYEIMMCPVGVQHLWWATHIIDIVALGLLITIPFINFQSNRPLAPIIEKRPSRKESISRATVNGSGQTLNIPRPTVTRSPSQGRRRA